MTDGLQTRRTLFGGLGGFTDVRADASCYRVKDKVFVSVAAVDVITCHGEDIHPHQPNRKQQIHSSAKPQPNTGKIAKTKKKNETRQDNSDYSDLSQLLVTNDARGGSAGLSQRPTLDLFWE